MIRFILLLVMASMFCTAEAQFDLSISAGAGFPIGDFAEQDIDVDDALIAQNGFYAALQSSYKLSNHFGLALVASYQRNTVNDESIAQQLAGSSADIWTSATDPYQQFYFMIGPTVGLQDGALSAHISPLVGAGHIGQVGQNTLLPALALSSSTIVDADWGLSYGGQVQLAYNLTEHLHIGLDARYLVANYERLGSGRTIFLGGIQDLFTVEYTKPVSTIQLGLHAGYWF